ncbi:cell division protein FtsB [Burkholderia anthina]|uniref:cell division protein FtsB n=1 Tax=Burkholderia anthina TaxID=179879 RepID=UPI0015885AF2|nr:cell division protein FtsB [Burkholderia anthina]
MRLVTVVLIALLALIQYPLWWGHGGWLRVHELRQQLDDQLQKNADEKLRNERIAGEVQDLQSGTAAIEERARYEMGMVKDGEVFVQFVSPNAPAGPLNNTPASTAIRADISAAPVRIVPNPAPMARSSRHHGEKGKAAHH